MKVALFASLCVVGCVLPAAAATRPGDFDGDGRTDMVSYFDAKGEWGIRSSSSGYLERYWVYLGGPEQRALNGDFDGDGRADFATYLSSTGEWTILRSTDGTRLVVNWGGPEYVAMPGDYDGDNKSDIAVYNRISGMWYVLNSGTNFSTAFSVDWGGRRYTAVSGDFDGDGRTDIAVYHAASGWWYVKTSSSGFTSAFWEPLGGPGYTPIPADFDGDGRVDLIVYHQPTGAWHIKTSSSNYTYVTVKYWGGIGYDATLGDFDGDGHADLAVYRRWLGGSYLGGAFYVLLTGSGYTTSVGGQEISMNRAAYAPLAPFPIPINGTDQTRAGDVDGDGQSDIVVYAESTGSWLALTSASSFTTTVPFTLGGPGFTAAPGDYDGDGRTDPAVFNNTTGAYNVLASTSNYTSTVSRTFNVTTGATYRFTFVPAAGDYDADGRTDMGIFGGEYGGQWLVKTSGGEFNATNIAARWGGTGITYWPAAPADYTGRGRTDIAVFQQDASVYKDNWFVLPKGTEGGYLFTSIPWGGAGCAPLPADYDGDGKADPTMYCPSTGRWYILASSSGFTRSTLVNLGTSTSTPVSGDYDGDGRADPAVYEPSTGQWTIALSRSGYATTLTRTFGGPGFVPLPTFPDPVGHPLPPNCGPSNCR